MLLATVFFATACSSESTPYDQNDAEGYTVSIRYDANGGVFTTNVSVIVDSYNISNLKPGNDGKVQLGLLAPDDEARGKTDSFKATKAGYFLEGWYTERIETTDSEGNTVYTYSGKWDFDNQTYALDPNGDYSSSEPVLTLYAAWVPKLEIQYVSLDTNEVLETYDYDPTETTQIKAPHWDVDSGKMKMYNFPERSGYTFAGAYYDAEKTMPVTGGFVEHTAHFPGNGTVEGGTMTIYIDWLEGEWYHIYTAEQLRKNANPAGHYVLEADLDFTGENWPSIFATGSFTGSIHGNGHTIQNVTFNQTKRDAENTGLFGTLQSGCLIEDVLFENVTFVVEKGFNRAANYGLFAGSIYEGAVLRGVQIKNSQLLIDSDARFATENYAIGLICGAGKPDQLAGAEISYAMTGKNPEKYTINLDEDGNNLILTAADAT